MTTNTRSSILDSEDSELEETCSLPEDVTDIGTPAKARPLRRTRGLLRRFSGIRPLTAAFLTLVLIALLTVGGTMYMHVRSVNEVDHARSDASAVATELVPKVLSYNYKDLNQSVPRAMDALTGQFKVDFQQLVDSAVRPAAESRQIVTQTTVESISVVKAAETDVTVLAFVNQTTTATDQKTPKVEGSRLRIGLHKSSGRWLISSMDPI
jgi:Mce-associated membrane protein